MDQLKDFLKLAVKYRFWIAAGISFLLPMIAYLVGSGPIKKKADEVTKQIEDADKGVAAYTSPGIPNDQYKPIVDEKTVVVSADVNKAWEKLYERQAPLLTWPDAPDGTKLPFREWGRKKPENVDRGAIQKAITDYIQVYDKVVSETYKKLNPWLPMEGTGIVVAADEKVLLAPSVFDIANPPKLTKVWSVQERLWVQGAVLDAIARINGKSKSWDDAIVRQLDLLDIGSPSAQDQKSIADGESPTKAPAVDPEDEAAADPAAAGGGGPGGMPEGAAAMMGRMMPGMGSGMGMGGAVQAVEDIYYVGTENPQFKVVPVHIQALVDQNRLQDFFIGLENSPMAIQVIEIEIAKPATPVTKPVKGEAIQGFGGMMAGYGMMGGGRMGMMGGMPGMMAGAEGMGMMPGGRGGMMGGMPGMMGGMPGMMAGAEGMGMMPGATGAAAKKGTDVRQKDAAKARQEKDKARKALQRAVSDQYYDIVQVTVYGRARFYNPPPPPEPTASESAAAPAPAADPNAPAQTGVSAAVDPGAPAAKAEAPKAEAPKADAPKAEAPKADAPKADAPKAEAPKADAPKAEAPKAEAPKAEAPKAEAPKAEAPKTDTPKADAPKADAPK